MKRIRILVADDSLTVRKRIVEVLEAQPDFEVVAEAADGREAIEACQKLRPDAVTLDMMMPVMTGLAATEYIMAYCPTPILVVSSSYNRGEVFKTYDALAAGALDVMEKPTGDEPEGEWEQALATRLRLISRIKVITHLRGRHALPGAPRSVLPASPARESDRYQLVAVGASTGGPAAAVKLLNSLPPDFPLPLLVVIHLSRTFGDTFADWLNGLSPFPVAFARDGQALPKPGQCQVLLAPPDQHLLLRDGRLRLSDGPERHSCRPSIDIFFESVAKEIGSASIAALLTGMGRDGAQGLLAVRLAGGVTIAQDEASCVVYGMPREAVQLNAAMKVLPLDQIAAELVSLTRTKTSPVS